MTILMAQIERAIDEKKEKKIFSQFIVTSISRPIENNSKSKEKEEILARNPLKFKVF